MKINYQNTIDVLKEAGLIKDGDKYAVCLFMTESESNGVTTKMTTSTVDYVMTANDEEIKLLDIDRKTGEYLGNCLVFRKDQIVYDKKINARRFIYASRGIFGECVVAIHFIPENFTHSYVLPKKRFGFAQKEARIELYGFVKEVYNTYYDALKKEYKEKK